VSCYFLAQIRIVDKAEFEKYLAVVDATFAGSDGEYLAVDDNVDVLEGEWSCTRAVLIRFRDEAALRRWYESEAYQQVLPLRLKAAECTTLVIHGK
jgi:uncharacterized protein (DUF1330 family)